MDVKQNDFNYDILTETAHRPWPMPASPWLMTQTWHNLLFCHWRVDRERLRVLVPAQLPLDTFDGHAWIAVVPFFMSNVSPRGVPALPWLSAFPELNVRTYVTCNGRPGVYFFSLDATNPVAVRVARALFHLPYFTAEMAIDEGADARIDYRSTRVDRRGRGAAFTARYRPVSPPQPPSAGSLEYFLTERYCLYTLNRRGHVCSVDIHHPPWPLQTAEAEIDRNTMAAAAGIDLPPDPPLLHFSRRQDIVAWTLARVDR